MFAEKRGPLNEKERLHAIVTGRVQGIGFRAFTQRCAVSLGLVGWVRNRWNGSVEVIAEGKKSDLKRLATNLNRGPFSGTTRQVHYDWSPATGEFTSFRIKMTG